MATVELTNNSFEQTVTNDDIVLVDFWASWCQPCLRFAPVYDRASAKHEGVTFAKVDTEANQELAGELGIEAIPTIMAFREGVLLFRQAGALSGGQLEQLITQVQEVDMDKVHAEVSRLQSEQGSAEHDHAGHDHAGHDHAGHDHAGQDAAATPSESSAR